MEVSIGCSLGSRDADTNTFHRVTRVICAGLFCASTQYKRTQVTASSTLTDLPFPRLFPSFFFFLWLFFLYHRFSQIKRAIQLREIITSLGPFYIKLGQALSIRPDILSPGAMVELQRLCDKVPSFDSTLAFVVRSLFFLSSLFLASLSTVIPLGACTALIFHGCCTLLCCCRLRPRKRYCITPCWRKASRRNLDVLGSVIRVERPS